MGKGTLRIEGSPPDLPTGPRQHMGDSDRIGAYGEHIPSPTSVMRTALFLTLALAIPGSLAAQTTAVSFRTGVTGADTDISSVDRRMGLEAEVSFAHPEHPIIGMAGVVYSPGAFGPDEERRGFHDTESYMGLAWSPQMGEVRPVVGGRSGLMSWQGSDGSVRGWAMSVLAGLRWVPDCGFALEANTYFGRVQWGAETATITSGYRWGASAGILLPVR